ncbi:hypothetical protein BRADI_2g54036v3 [Brachypodium distachyon]|uniref:Uncharacterized protein n=1 Tax=Brachypodium distachyon TaxID=15368 RepID=A0A0Q3JDL3_BRADI|nr:hypothetical protein BRADI_2g54036v3 [Brachypodium distachyon]
MQQEIHTLPVGIDPRYLGNNLDNLVLMALDERLIELHMGCRVRRKSAPWLASRSFGDVEEEECSSLGFILYIDTTVMNNIVFFLFGQKKCAVNNQRSYFLMCLDR